MNEYLPSKKFIRGIIGLIIILAILFGIYKIAEFFIHKIANRKVSSLTVSPSGNIQKDTNENGIPDWEESLWGFDPTKDGDANKAAIEQKKAALAQSADSSSTEDTATTDDDTASREFFAAVLSLQDSGNLNDTTLQSVADEFGQKIVAAPIADIYTSNNIKTEPTNSKNDTAYFSAMKNLFVKYQNKNIGDELTFINQALANNDPQALQVAVGVALSYRAFSKDILNIAVPVTLAQNHLAMANNYEKTAETIEDMAKVFDQPTVAMKAFVNYKKYNDALVANIDDLSESLPQ